MANLAKRAKKEARKKVAKKPVKIVVTARNNEFHAHVGDRPGLWGYGSTRHAAIGSLIDGHNEIFNVVIEAKN
ncbi:MAG TPA: hypothetical protein VMV71_04495 [Candidatus Paceibacterota bacterium]|nr:hypothetical protein [Candidatus Paceibacterota bacterium]